MKSKIFYFLQPNSMKTKFFLKFFSIIILIGVSACAKQQVNETTDVPENEESISIVLGDISDDPGEVIEGSQPLADYLAAGLTEFGITVGEVRIATDVDEMTQLLEDGEVDLYFDSVYPVTQISDAIGAQPILRRWRYGVEEYFTVIFTSEDSGIDSLTDLNGHMMAFDNPFSTSGFLLPAVTLVEEGFTLIGKTGYDEQVSEQEIGFVFSYDDENTLQWVLSGFVAAGATDDYHFYVAFPEEVTEKLIVLAETDSVPRQVVLARPGINPDLLQAIINRLVGANEDPAAQAALEAFQTTQFDVFPEGIEAAQGRMRDMMQVIQGLQMP
jgi:phosphonate transport system substrate-binding protein